MFYIKFKQHFISLLISLFLVAISVCTHADFKQWPLRAKGEVRYLKMIKVYDASLFSPRSISAETILQPNVSKCLQQDYTVNLSEDKFRLATEQILKRQHDDGFLKKIKQPLEQLQSAYKPVRKGDYYMLCYDATTQTIRLDLNKEKLVEIRSAELATAYLGIWLSKNKPISYNLYRSFFPSNKVAPTINKNTT